MTTAQYWQGLTFDSITSYSLLREPQLQQWQQQRQQLIAAIEAELRTARYLRQPALHRQLQRLRQDTGQTLTNESGALHPTAIRLARLPFPDAAITALRRILMRPVERDIWSGCAPVYRDALVFADAAGQRVGVLNICLECAFLCTGQGELLQRDVRVFDELRNWLRTLGHPVEDGPAELAG